MINTVLNATITATLIAAVAYFAFAAVAFVHDRIASHLPAAAVVEIVEQPTVTPAIEPTTAPVIEPMPEILGVMKPLELMTWRELQPIAKAVGVKNRRNLKKAELLEAIAQLA